MGHLFRFWLGALLWGAVASLPQTQAGGANSNSNGYVGDQACATCHSSIYNSYEKTSMAQASGPAINNFFPADFVHQKSGVHYRIYSDQGKVWLSFERPNDPNCAWQARVALLHRLRAAREKLFVCCGWISFRVASELVHRPAALGHGACVWQRRRNANESAGFCQLFALPR